MGARVILLWHYEKMRKKLVATVSNNRELAVGCWFGVPL
jgi:hypothetical protein